MGRCVLMVLVCVLVITVPISARASGILWELDLPGRVELSPMITEGGGVYVAAGQTMIVMSFEGVVAWSSGLLSDINYIAPGPAGGVYASTSTGRLFRFSREGRIAWSEDIEVIGGMDVIPDGIVVGTVWGPVAFDHDAMPIWSYVPTSDCYT